MTEVTRVLKETAVRRVYEVAGAPPMNDHSGREFQPETVEVKISTTGHRWVAVKGPIATDARYPRVGGRHTQGGYSFREDGDVEPDYRRGEAPMWLKKLVADTLTELSQ